MKNILDYGKDQPTENEIFEFMKAVHAPPPPGKKRHFWFDGDWYISIDGQCYIKGEEGDGWIDGQYYPCCIIALQGPRA